MFWGVFGFWGSLLGSIPFWGVPGLVYPTFERVSGGAYSLFRGGGGGVGTFSLLFGGALLLGIPVWLPFLFGGPAHQLIPVWG